MSRQMLTNNNASRVSWKTGLLLGLVGLLSLSACQTPSSITPSKKHFLRPTDPPPGALMTPLPKEAVDVVADTGQIDLQEGEVISITVNDTPARTVLLALARDTKKNLDIHPGIKGNVTISVVDQTLPRVLERIAKQVNMRFEIDGDTILVYPDKAFLKIYQVDYVNMARSSKTTNKISTQLDTNRTLDPSITGKEMPNQSDMTLTTEFRNDFWASLTANINAIVGQNAPGASPALPTTPATLNGGLPLPGAATGSAAAPAQASSASISNSVVSINQETGVISIFATAADHERVSEYLESLMENAHRQVLIESTVVEVALSDDHQQGVDWASINDNGLSRLSAPFLANTIGVTGALRPTALSDLPIFSLPTSLNTSHGKITSTVRALAKFGNTKVLSSPKIMALNNQTAVLKVVDNTVFFTVEAQAGSTSNASGGTDTTALINTRVHTVPVGLVMSVTPQISADDVVTLNVRPTISSISRWVKDPNPHLTSGDENLIPEIQVKEMESILRVHSGQITVMGGLMQDKLTKNDSGLPLISRVPGIGGMFGYKEKSVSKTELVIFMRPVVMTHGKPRGVTVANSSASTNTVVTPRAMGAPDPAAMGAMRAPAMKSHKPQASNGGYLDFTSRGNQSVYVAPSPARPAAPVAAPAPQAGRLHIQQPSAVINVQSQVQQPVGRVPMAPQAVTQQPMMPQQTVAQPMATQPQQWNRQPVMQQQPAYPAGLVPQPGYGQPMMQQPAYGQPMMQQPAYGQPMMQQGYQQPMAPPAYGLPQGYASPNAALQPSTMGYPVMSPANMQQAQPQQAAMAPDPAMLAQPVPVSPTATH
ncbi:pilus (MSHA type) biogenesis protein MshL [Magnetococcus sp. PR-3]|uniref:pilus (MSHA type) biogenesis protein MshL n=1 Tax=Magnetococcus sp. PR-3 TaxID=3120355 RepID=UPI002FCE2154